MNLRSSGIALAFFLGILGSSCRHSESSIIIVHVLRDPSQQVAKKLAAATRGFDLGKPHISSGKGVMIAAYEGSAYSAELERVAKTQPDIVIFGTASELSNIDPSTAGRLGTPTSICSGSVAYVPDWVTGENRDAAGAYLQFLLKNCA